MSGRPDVLDPTPFAPDAFAERVMAAIRRESPPTPTRAFVSAVRARSPRDARAALWTAWHLGTVRGWSIAPRVRARSIALVLAVTCALGTGSLATAAAVRVAAEPVAQLFHSGADEHGPVENHPSGVDEQGPAEQKPVGDGTQQDSQSDRDAPSGGAAGSEQPSGGHAENDESDTDGAGGEDADTDGLSTDGANDEDVDSDQSEGDDGTGETADDESDADESDAADDADDADAAEDGSASDEPDADEPDSDDADGGEEADDGEGGESSP